MKRGITPSARALRLLAWLTLGCRGDAWVVAGEIRDDVGGIDDPTAATEETEDCPGLSALAEARAQTLGRDTPDAAHVGRWRGTLSGAAARGFPGLDVVLVANADGSGVLEFTGFAPLAAPSSATQPYLCDGSVSGGICGSESGFVGGFSYPVEAMASRGDVLSFSIVDADPWSAWCALQDPVPRLEPAVACGTSWNVLPPSAERWSPTGCTLDLEREQQPIDCGLMYALERCQCARDGCTASFFSTIDVGLAVSADDNYLSGWLWFRNGTQAALLSLSRES